MQGSAVTRDEDDCDMVGEGIKSSQERLGFNTGKRTDQANYLPHLLLHIQY